MQMHLWDEVLCQIVRVAGSLDVLRNVHARNRPAEMKRGLPGRVTPELLNSHSWNTLKLMSLNQWMQLKQRLDAEVETVDWITCRKIANELNLSYEQVLPRALVVLTTLKVSEQPHGGRCQHSAE